MAEVIKENLSKKNLSKGKLSKRKLSKGVIVLISLAGVLLAGIIAVVIILLCNPTIINGFIIEPMLVNLAKDKELECNIEADIAYGSFVGETEVRFWRTELDDGVNATSLQMGKMQVYIVEGCLYLENGRGFKLEGNDNEKADYSKAINGLPDLLKDYKIYSSKTAKGKRYSVLVTGEGAIDYVYQLYPDYADKIDSVDDIEITLLVENSKITEIGLEGSAVLNNGNEAELDAKIEIIPVNKRSDHSLPKAVEDNLGDEVEKLTISQDMIDIAYAIGRFYSKDPNRADLSISTDIAFFDLGYDNMGWYRCKIDDEWINYVQVGSKKYYFNGNGRCDEAGKPLSDSQSSAIDIATIVDTVYDIFLAKKFTAVENNGVTEYQLILDKEDISGLVGEFAPSVLNIANKVNEAVATITAENGQITGLNIVLTGHVQVLFINKDFDVVLTFTPATEISESDFDIPDAVIEELIGK